MRNRTNDIMLGLVGVSLIIGGWEIAGVFGALDPRIFPRPSAAVLAAADKLKADRLAENIFWSLYRVFGGFLLGCLAGIVIGILAGWFRTFGRIVRPVLEVLRPIPPLAWIPLAIIWFGLGEPSKFFIIFLGAFFPVVTATYFGVRGIDPLLIRAGQTLGVTGWRLLVKIVLPAASPDLATGIRIGWGLSFGVLVAAELIAADRGLGFMIMNERNTGGSVSVIIVGILIIGALNLLTDAILAGLIHRWIGRWHGQN